MQAFAHSRRARAQHDVAHYSEEAEVIMMPVFDPGYIGYNDPSQSGRLIDRARELSMEFLARPAAAEA